MFFLTLELPIMLYMYVIIYLFSHPWNVKPPVGQRFLLFWFTTKASVSRLVNGTDDG